MPPSSVLASSLLTFNDIALKYSGKFVLTDSRQAITELTAKRFDTRDPNATLDTRLKISNYAVARPVGKSLTCVLLLCFFGII